MSPVARFQAQERTEEFSVREYSGRNSFGQHASLAPGEFRDCVNWDLVTNVRGQDELRSRRGSRFLRPEATPAKWPATDIPRTATWDVGAEEYEFGQVGTSIYYQALLTPGNPTLVNDFAGDPWTLGDTRPADLFVHADRLFIIHPTGNRIVEWNGTVFRGRDLGLEYPSIWNLSSDVGDMRGRYVYGLEKVYRVGEADVLVSSPNRKYYGSRELADTGNQLNLRYLLRPEATTIADTLWTHLRLWRSKNLAPDFSDPTNPIEPQGLEDELYEVALITRAELEADGLTAIATGEDLPEGNANVRAGLVEGAVTIEDNNTDSALFNLIGLDRIELEPLPAAVTGCFVGGRVWVSGVDGSNDILYSNAVGTKYSELHDPENVVETGRDGIQMVRLIAFDRDVVGLKESKTGRLVNADPDQAWETTDHRLGIRNAAHAAYLPGIGIAAIVNDNQEFQVYGLDHQWSTLLYGLDVSLPIRADLAALDLDGVRFAYVNGKLLLSDGAGVLHVLHARFRKGWTRYTLPINTGGTLNLFTFAGGTRAGVVSADAYTLEIEVADRDLDDSIEDDTEGLAITLSQTPHMYQSDGGKHILEQEWYSIEARLSTPMRAYPYMNGLPWPSGSTELEAPFVVSPYAFQDGALREREYRLFLPPQQIGTRKWNRFHGNFLHYRFETEAPAVMRGQGMRAVVDDGDSAFLNQDPYQRVVLQLGAPNWNSPVLMHLTFDEATGLIARDISGHNRHHTWTPGDPAGSTTYDAALAPGGGRSVVAGTDSGYECADWTGLDYIGDNGGFNSRALAYEYVVSVPSLASAPVIHESGDGTNFWLIRVNTDGSLEYQISIPAFRYKFVSPAGVVAGGSTEYTIQFVLSNGGQNGQFYAGPRTGAFAELLTTRSAL